MMRLVGLLLCAYASTCNGMGMESGAVPVEVDRRHVNAVMAPGRNPLTIKPSKAWTQWWWTNANQTKKKRVVLLPYNESIQCPPPGWRATCEFPPPADTPCCSKHGFLGPTVPEWCQSPGVDIRDSKCCQTDANGSWTCHSTYLRDSHLRRDGVPVNARRNPVFLWMGPLLSWSGFAAEARSYVQMLAPSIPNMIGRQFGDVADLGVLKTLFSRENTTLTAALGGYIQGGSPVVVVCQGTPNHWFGGGYESLGDCPPKEGVRLKIGRAMFETDSLPPGWADQCNKMDKVWVPSQWNVETFANAGVNRSKLVVIPEAVDTETKFNPKMTGVPYPLPIPPPVSLNGPSDDALLEVFGLNEEPSVSPHWVEDTDTKPFKFLSIFKWHMRKGVDVLLQAYCEEFTEEEPVVLYIKTNRYSYKMDPKTDLRSMIRSISRSLKPGSKLPRIKLLDEWIADTRLPALYSAADAFVLPSRGEGWGLPQAEAMAMGLPTIITDWSGTTAFATKNTAILVNYTLREMKKQDMDDMYDGGSFQLLGHKFAEPSVADLRAKMRWVYEHPAEAKAIGAAAREHMRANFSPKVVSKIITDHLESTVPGVFKPGADVQYEWSRRDVTSTRDTLPPSHSTLPGRVLANPYTWSKA